MTSTEIRAPNHRWLRAIGYGLLAEVATIVTIILVVMAYKYVFARGLSDPEYAAFGQRAGGYIGVVGGAIYTYIFARWLMPRLSSRFSEHGMVVALAAIALSIAGSIAGHQGVPVAYIAASILKIVAGATAGFVYSRSVAVNRMV
ncbi:MAG TPA: hypothetical protein VK565_11015 [Gemmatimonadaceae bacterium]|nr:hypothetical protein [Gemmatimonadaceae bacterium]